MFGAACSHFRPLGKQFKHICSVVFTAWLVQGRSYNIICSFLPSYLPFVPYSLSSSLFHQSISLPPTAGGEPFSGFQMKTGSLAGNQRFGSNVVPSAANMMEVIWPQQPNLTLPVRKHTRKIRKKKTASHSQRNSGPLPSSNQGLGFASPSRCPRAHDDPNTNGFLIFCDDSF